MQMYQSIMELHKSVVKIHNSFRIFEHHETLEEFHKWFMYLYTSIIELKHRLMELHSLNDGAS